MNGPDGRPEDEYSYPPEGVAISTGHLLALGIQIAAPSRRPVETTRLHATPLSDEAIARIRARSKRT